MIRNQNNKKLKRLFVCLFVTSWSKFTMISKIFNLKTFLLKFFVPHEFKCKTQPWHHVMCWKSAVLDISTSLNKKLNFLEFCIGIDNGEAYPFWT
jgi:hypothetical protein